MRIKTMFIILVTVLLTVVVMQNTKEVPFTFLFATFYISKLVLLLSVAVVSFIVGILMSAFGWTPYDIYYGVRDFFWHLWNMGFRAIDRFVAYFLLGAAIVIPAFIILRVLSYRR